MVAAETTAIAKKSPIAACTSPRVPPSRLGFVGWIIDQFRRACQHALTDYADCNAWMLLT